MLYVCILLGPYALIVLKWRDCASILPHQMPRCRILIQCLVPTIEFQELGIPLLFHEYLAVTMCLSLLIRFHA